MSTALSALLEVNMASNLPTRRSFLKLVATALGSLLPLHLLGEVKSRAKQYVPVSDFSSQNVWVYNTKIYKQKDIDMSDFLETLDCPFEVTIVRHLDLDPELTINYSYKGKDGPWVG